MEKKVALYLITGFEEVEALAVVDVLRRAEIPIVTVSLTGEHLIKGGHDIWVKADVLFDDLTDEEIEMMVLPGGSKATEKLYGHQGLKDQIQRFHDKQRPLAAICAAPSVYGRMGLLQGQQAVAFPAYNALLQGADVVDAPAVTSGHFITSKGIGTAMDFALEIVKKYKGEEAVNLLRKKMVMP